MSGEVERSKIPALTGYEERGARNVTAGLVERGIDVSETFHETSIDTVIEYAAAHIGELHP